MILLPKHSLSVKQAQFFSDIIIVQTISFVRLVRANNFLSFFQFGSVKSVRFFG